MRVIVLVSALVASPAAPVSAAEPIACTADLSLMGAGEVSVEISSSEAGKLQARINGEVTNEEVAVVEELIRPNLNLRLDPYSEEFEEPNTGEQSLVHMHRLLDDSRAENIINLPFELSAVSRIRTYDLTGTTDKFGGTVLLEAFGANDTLLGRVLRRIMVASCE